MVLEGYREWTESLGSDREWKIQAVQGELDKISSLKASECEAFYLPTRRDVLTFILNNVDINCFENVVKEIEKASPVPLKVIVGYGRTPLEALWNPLEEGEEGPVTAVHVDIDHISVRPHYLGYVEAVGMFDTLVKMALPLGGVVSYLGGDNVIAFLGKEEAFSFASSVLNLFKEVKIGIGIGKRPREAVAKAAEGLRIAREERGERIVTVY
ncbi:hypothetical protein IPA_03160 [Ignicoccus pacificus DSM 13166]|uniref:GTP cyclohydrolase III n=1 Tax=Ignicoccus pacificus DSM 13166 TaxID=940294 RepID=A0A977PKQ8_9CREN|nr:hypothetical protein IPA_03160 [Ignicoccus pacificus DSM 13166]